MDRPRPAPGGPEVEIALVEQPPVTGDVGLVERARAGDTRAFGELVERHMRRAYYAALGLTGSHEDALDLSQEAFVRAFRARRKLEPGRPFYPWYYRILRNLCFNRTRDRRRRRERLETATPWLVAEARDRAARRNPERRLAREEQYRAVREALERLPARDREILVLKEFEGLRYREIAELLQIPLGTVMSRLYTARRRLAEAMEDAS